MIRLILCHFDVDHRARNTYTTKIFSMLHLKVSILPQLCISGLREFQFIIVRVSFN